MGRKQDQRGSDVIPKSNSPGFLGEKAAKGSARTERESRADIERETERERGRVRAVR